MTDLSLRGFSPALGSTLPDRTDAHVLVIATYDVADDRRRHRVSLSLEARGARVQLSVFECELADRQAFAALRHEIEEIIDPAADQIRFYTLSTSDGDGIEIVGERRLEERQDFYIV